MLNIHTLAIFNLSCISYFLCFSYTSPKQHTVLFWAIKIITLRNTFYTSKMGYERQFYIQNKNSLCQNKNQKYSKQFLDQPIFPSPSKMWKTIQMYYKHRSCYTNTFIILHVILRKVSSILIRIVGNIFFPFACSLQNSTYSSKSTLVCVCVQLLSFV